MKLLDQVITLEQAKKLKELGFSKESYFRWCIGGDKCEDAYTIISEDDDSASYTERVPAYTASELMEFMENNHHIRWIENTYNHVFNEYVVTLHSQGKRIHGVSDKNYAKALGDMLVYLLENIFIRIK